MRNSMLGVLALLALAGCPATDEGTAQPTAGAPAAADTAMPAGETKAAGAPSPSLLVVTKTFSVTGMHCEDCSKAIEGKLISMAGVTTVSADEKTGRTVVQYDEGKVTDQEIIAAIDSLSFKAKLATQ